MGNTRSQPSEKSKPLYLFYLIHRTWSIVADHRKEHDRNGDIDGESNFSSRCSGCNGCKACDYGQNSLTFDSESDMAPNAEEDLLAAKSWGPQPEKERLRPPTYNAEDYAIALRRWGRRPMGSVPDSHGTLPSTTSSSSGYASGSGEMTLRQFTSVSELLNKLRADLRLAFPSFVQEFGAAPADGITLLLETLRGVQLAQSSPPSSGHTGPRIGTRRAALDELGCVECLAACGERCADAARLLVEAPPGLLALAVCLTSSLNRSRVLALQVTILTSARPLSQYRLLTKVCQAPGGHAAVSEAVSTLRLKYGEGGRFRFLAGALLAPRAAIALRVAGVSFLNAFLKSAPRTQTRLYIQAEACEAGLEPQVLQEWLRELDDREEDALHDLLRKEVQKWTHNCVDVDALQRRALRAEETCRMLSKKVAHLQGQLQKYQLEKLNGYNLEERDKCTSVITTQNSPKVSSNAEDEGISSSERSSSPEDNKIQSRASQKINPSQDNDQETTIDDVIEELRIIVKDAEEKFSEKNQEQKLRDEETSSNDRSAKSKLYRTNSKVSLSNSESYLYEKVIKRDERKDLKTARSTAGSNVSQNMIKGEQVTYFGNDRDYSTDSSATRRLTPEGARRISKSSVDGSVKIMVKGPDVEEAIVPTILHPQPPRRTPPCLSALMAARHCDFVDHVEPYNSHDEEIEEETLGDGSDSLLSASRLKYNGKSDSYDRQMQDTPVENYQKQPRKELAMNTNEKLKKSFDDLRHYDQETKEKKTIRNYDSTSEAKGRTPTEIRTNKQSEDYRQFPSETQNVRQSTDRQSSSAYRHSSKYRSEVEKRKHLRRSASQDYIESNPSSPRSRRSNRSRVECRIRKFESLNSFDDHRSLQSYGRPGSSDNISKQEQLFMDDGSRSRMRRSESFHHVSHVARKDNGSSRGGSDSGLLYVTDFNLEPLVTRRPRSTDAPKSPNMLTKSLDRIDEGLDSMVDIVITQEKNQWGNRYQAKSKKSREEKLVSRSKSGRLDDTRSCCELETRSRREDSSSRSKHLKNDEFYGSRVNNKQLRSDELYEERRNREWNYQNELNSAKKLGSLDFESTHMILPKSAMRHHSFCQTESVANQFSSKSIDSGIFAGRTYDTFGLGKSRFNAGKYSGNQQLNETPVGRRNTTSSAIGVRGKVTDIVSGLY